MITDGRLVNVPLPSGEYAKALRVEDVGNPGEYVFVDARALSIRLAPLWLFLERFYVPPPPPPPVEINIPLPPDKELLPFQIDGVRDIVLRPGNTLLADEMGLGKTIQALAAINVMKPARVLIVCPNNLKLNWAKEAKEWLVIDDEWEVAYTQLYMFSDKVIMSYETLVRWLPGMLQDKWDLLIVDEAHMAKNPGATRAKAVYEIAKRADRVLFMTGTPIVNYPYELFPLIHALDKEVWPSASAFMNRYTFSSNAKMGRNLKELQEKLRSTIMTRRLKKDVLSDLPPKRRQIIEFPCEGLEELIEEEKRIWGGKANDDNAIIATIMEVASNAKEGEEVDWAGVVDSLKYTKRYFFTEMARIRHKVALAKLPMVLEHLDEIVEEANGEAKVVVFGHHLDVLGAIHDHFASQGAVLITGATSNEERFAAIERFQTDPTCHMFIGGMKVASLGITLTASAHVVFAELDWVPGTITQAEDRTHRIGQTASKILVQHLVLEDSLDAYMAKTIIKKQKQIDKALNR